MTQIRTARRWWLLSQKLVMFSVGSLNTSRNREGHFRSLDCCLHCSPWPTTFSLHLISLEAWKNFYSLFQSFTSNLFSLKKHWKSHSSSFFPEDKLSFCFWGCKVDESVVTSVQHKETAPKWGIILKEYKWVGKRAWET